MSIALGSDPDDATDPGPAAVIGAVLACLHAAVTAWAAAGGAQPLTAFSNHAMDTIG